MTWNIPNILTVLRLLAAPAIAVFFLLLPRPFADWAALAVFILASLTDYLDGFLARRWKQVSKLGAMMDPIADKAMVVIALAVMVVFSSLSLWILFPATLILFREVFVSGLREFLGDVAGTLKVTQLAKWKTATQMVAITVLIIQGLFEHYFGMWTWGMDYQIVQDIIAGNGDDPLGVRYLYNGMIWSTYGAIGLMWIAAALTVITGFDYFRKAAPHLRD
ncbi:CDP-diacylglycerol--glycerol-3-phosphate 3-phosphatidyltransferase [Cognatishimia sp.]|uniref:CDP-diacylglycerol--glycerol-3-phosphate 3-phosphatidyltransferase n=1 Tax=Cognatishimia sp. TaxID=2211648 RepID=UPI003513FB36|nr:CDP-diacylglycerol--glycerol-3-phosphate 3-phosphatidyltransferase [Cognatishimia sp.]